MTVSPSDSASADALVPGQGRTGHIRVEPMVGLEWSQAMELTADVHRATQPAEARRAWIHRAPEFQVVGRYRVARQFVSDLPAPWWLRVLAMGGLASRDAAFALEDSVHHFLMSRQGWVYVPWVSEGETGYWEFVPSENHSVGLAYSVPTTVAFTHRHQGWLDVLPAHRGQVPARMPIRGLDDLMARIEDIEKL